MQQSQPPQQPQMQAPQQPQQRAAAAEAGLGRHRKKKKFFQQRAVRPPSRSRATASFRTHQGRRKERQRGPRTFVGPMDHSYRDVNGNVADWPPSTIPLGATGTKRRQLLDANVGSPSVPVKADAPDPHLLLHRRSLLPGEDSGDGEKVRR